MFRRPAPALDISVLRGRVGLIAALLASCILCLALLAARMIYSGRETYAFLAWNLVLALIPLSLAFLVDVVMRRGLRIFLPLLLFLWVVFLPNAPYVITDFVHLSYDPPVPLWFDLLLFTTFAWTGLLLGLISIHLLKEHAIHHLGAATTWTLIVIVLAASSTAIYLGRFEQWNSWDLLVRPFTVLKDLFSLRSLPRAAGVTAGFTAFLLAAYASVEALISSGRSREASLALAPSGPRSTPTSQSELPSPADSHASQEQTLDQRLRQHQAQEAPPRAS